MKNSIYLLCFLSLIGYQAEAGHSYGSLAWDHDNYIKRTHKDSSQDTAMDYIKDFNERIEESLGDGNILRAEYLSDLLLKFFATGGSYGFRQGPNAGPTVGELHDLNKAVALTARSVQVKVRDFPDPDYIPLKDLEDKIYDKFTDLDKYSSQAAPDVLTHTNLLKDLFMAHLQEGGVPQSTRVGCTHPDKNQYPDFETHPERVRSLIGLADRAYTQALFNKPVTLKRFYTPIVREGDIRLEPPLVGNDVIIHDFIRNEKFLLAYTPADSHCWLHAISCNNDYYARDFLGYLLTLSDADRKKAARFMAKKFLDAAQNKSPLLPHDKLSKFLTRLSKVPELKKINNLFWFPNLNESLQNEFIHIISQKEVFAAFVTQDLSAEAEDLWQGFPDGHTNYTGLYAHLHNKNVVTFQFSAYTSPDQNPYIYLDTRDFFSEEENTKEYVYYFSGNSHAGMLLPLPLQRKVESANRKFFNTWYSRVKGEKISSDPPPTNPS